MDHPRTDRPRQQRFKFGIAERLEAILARCGDRLKTGSSLFDARGQREARAIAERDRPLGGK